MKTRKKTLPWNLLSKYRTPLMGIAIIGIYLTHYKQAYYIHKIPYTRFVNFLGYGTSGVDIFMILSGLGLCYSFAKDDNLLHFYRKRLVRLLPAYVITQLVFFILRVIRQGHVNMKAFLERMFFIRYFRDGDTGFWFIMAILIFYLIFPLLYKEMEIMKKHRYLNLVICLVIYAFLQQLLWDVNPTLYGHIISMVQRFPAFMLGVWIGRECLDDREFSVFLIPVWWVITAALMRRYNIPFFPEFEYSIGYYVLTCGALSLIFFFVLIFEYLGGTWLIKQCMRFFAFLGGITLECYLMHSLFKWIFTSPVWPPAYVLTCCALPTAAAWVLHQVCSRIAKKLS